MKRHNLTQKEFHRRINAICRNYNIELLSKDEIISAIAEAAAIDDRKKVKDLRVKTELMILFGHYQSKNGKWAKLRPEDIQKVIDWIRTAKAYKAPSFGAYRSLSTIDDIEIRLESIRSIIARSKKIPIKKRLPKKIPTIWKNPSIEKRSTPSSSIALRLLKCLIPKTNNPRKIKSGDTDVLGRAATATEAIMNLMGRPFSKKSLLKAFQQHRS